ncbi:hypothetical protein SCHPADRAFT_941320 [Schizopora paradoxa]|uniref:C2H2-type domain-containing protein n=1 Tax=Schizopora paradoxa TaxID=27342 RepID=A0A0H2RS92_9AGAM|nr:hypothetical protein SCHPADRAFT_941320 [Schizopora paradoxa]
MNYGNLNLQAWHASQGTLSPQDLDFQQLQQELLSGDSESYPSSSPAVPPIYLYNDNGHQYDNLYYEGGYARGALSNVTGSQSGPIDEAGRPFIHGTGFAPLSNYPQQWGAGFRTQTPVPSTSKSNSNFEPSPSYRQGSAVPPQVSTPPSQQTIRNPNRYYCDYEGCDKNYSKRHNLNFHTSKIHNNTYTLRCKEEGCDQSCLNGKLLAEHAKTHCRHTSRITTAILTELSVPSAGRRSLVITLVSGTIVFVFIPDENSTFVALFVATAG